MSKKSISNYIINKIREVPINKRLIISFLMISTIPIILLFSVINTTTINLIKKSIINNDKVASNLIIKSVEDYINKFDSITNEIIWNSTITNDMQNYENLNQSQKNEFNTQMSKILSSRTTYISDIADFTLFNSDLEVLYNEGFSYINNNVKLKKIKDTINENKVSDWTFIKSKNYNYITTIKQIKIGENTYGYVFLAIKEKVILELFEKYNIDFKGYGLILDEKSKNIISNNKNTKYLVCDKTKKIKVINKIDKNTIIVKFENKKFIVSNSHISYTDWRLIGVVPYEYIYLSCMDMYKTYGIVFLFVLLTSIAISMLINKSIAKPINEIVNNMNNLNEDNIASQMVVSGNDEISFIMKKYNEMTTRISALLLTIKRREMEKREAKLKMLQAQINPHFLFNTLGGLRYVAMMNNDNIVSQGLDALAKLLRSTITNNDDFINLYDEIENVKNYITIQKIRYGDMFDISYKIENNLENEKILKFILQPIVENCILHGFDESSEINTININAYVLDEYINIDVIDNGVGIVKEKLEQGSFNIDKFAGIGVKNIKEKLNIYYNGNFSFWIRPNKTKGTITKIVIPKLKGELNESVDS